MKRAILHIGTHKTGTTSLQTFLRDNAEELTRQGITPYWPAVKYEGISMHRTGHFLFRYVNSIIEPQSDEESGRDATERNIEKLGEMVSAHDTLLLTDESLWRLGAVTPDAWRVIHEMLTSSGVEEVQVIVYFRRQDQFVLSFWNQLIKGDTNPLPPIPRFAKRNRMLKILDYQAGVKALAEEFGKGNVTIRAYERAAMENGDIRWDFCRVIGVDPTTLAFNENYVNPGLDRDVVEVKRIVNSVPGYRDAGNFLQMPAIKASLAPSSKPPSLTYEEREGILARYRDGNAELAREFLHNEDGMMFSPLEPESPGSTVSRTSEERLEGLVKGAVRFFTAAAMQERDSRLKAEARVAVLERQLAELERKAVDYEKQVARLEHRFNIKARARNAARRIQRKLRKL